MVPAGVTEQQLLERLVRYADLRPCTSAFIDTRTPGSRRKENFTIIGPGVAENPEQHVHIDIPHGFNIGGARQPAGCVNSQHSHETAEVFVVHSGRWAFNLGPNGEDGSIELGPGDTISIPIHVFRGFTNVGDGDGFLFAVLGGDDPGHVTWAPYVFDQAKDHGLVLLKNGRLIDTATEKVPSDQPIMPPTTQTDVDRLDRMTAAELSDCVVTAKALAANPVYPFGADAGVVECPIIGPVSEAEGMPAGALAWSHGFQLRYVSLARGGATPLYARAEPEVLMVHKGELELAWADGTITLQPGDVFTCPIDLVHRYRNAGELECVVYVVRGGDQPGGYRLIREDQLASAS